jgi:hypothetical protein
VEPKGTAILMRRGTPTSSHTSPKRGWKEMTCKHDTLELVEKDDEHNEVWMRCADCFVLFKFTKEEFEKLEEVKKWRLLKICKNLLPDKKLHQESQSTDSAKLDVSYSLAKDRGIKLGLAIGFILFLRTRLRRNWIISARLVVFLKLNVQGVVNHDKTWGFAESRDFFVFSKESSPRKQAFS